MEMLEVIKRDGRRQPFCEDRLRDSIEASAREARVPNRRIRQLVNYVTGEFLDLSAGENVIETRMIRKIVLARLDIVEPLVSDAWRVFDETKGHDRCPEERAVPPSEIAF
jgi:transcriptional regulator NrdR family protein